MLRKEFSEYLAALYPLSCKDCGSPLWSLFLEVDKEQGKVFLNYACANDECSASFKENYNAHPDAQVVTGRLDITGQGFDYLLKEEEDSSLLN